MPHQTNTPESFWARVDRSDPDGCWPWTGSLKSGNGYGNIRYQGKYWRPSRLAYFLTSGEDPGDRDVLHHCDNPPCCRFAHFFLGDDQANLSDMVAKGRSLRGDRHYRRLRPETVTRGEQVGGAKLTAAQVVAIRARYAEGGCSQRALAKEYGVLQQQISRIVRGRRWSHVS